MLAVVVAALSSVPVMGAGYDDYDDDIYYNAAKAKEKAEKKAAEKAMQEAEKRASQAYVPNRVVDYEDPALVVVNNGSGLNVDVDVYNRRGQFLVSDTVAPMSSADVNPDTYEYTRRIERYYNSDIVNASGDAALIDSYYSTSPDTDINIYVVNASPWAYNSWYNPWGWNSFYWNSWYYPSWSLSWNYYNPWYSWSWGWGPSWSWGPSWGWGPSWSWGPSWGWGGPSWGGPGHIHHPGHMAVTTPGASRPHTPVGVSSTTGRRPGAFSAGAHTSFTRPGAVTRPSTTPSAGSISRPSTTPSRPGTGMTPSTTRGRNTTVTTPSSSSPSRSTPSSSGSSSVRSTGSSRGHSTVGGGARSGGGSAGGSGRGRR